MSARRRLTYVDSSAIVKLVVAEPESKALRRYLARRQPLVSSALARTEVVRALMPSGEDAVARGQEVLRRGVLLWGEELGVGEGRPREADRTRPPQWAYLPSAKQPG